MEKISVKCDCCEKELVVDSKYPNNYGIHLSVKDYGVNTNGSVYAVYTTPPLKSSKDFCNLECLEKWLESNTSHNASYTNLGDKK